MTSPDDASPPRITEFDNQRQRYLASGDAAHVTHVLLHGIEIGRAHV